MKIVLVEWIDSYGPTPRWESLDDVEFSTCVCYSVGRLLDQTDSHCAIVPHWSDQTYRTLNQGSGIMVIPTPAINKITVLKEL